MSIRCMTLPPSTNPIGFASFGRATCTVSVSEADGEWGRGALTGTIFSSGLTLHYLRPQAPSPKPQAPSPKPQAPSPKPQAVKPLKIVPNPEIELHLAE